MTKFLCTAPPIISGMGKDTNLKFGQNIRVGDVTIQQQPHLHSVLLKLAVKF